MATLFQLLFLTQPEPDEAVVAAFQRMDWTVNPNNDSHKPKLRTIAEICADYKAATALAQLEQLAAFTDTNKRKIAEFGGFTLCAVEVLPTEGTRSSEYATD